MKRLRSGVVGNGMTSAAHSSEVVKRTWARDTAHTLALANVVHAARERLSYRQWTQLWKTGHMQFSKRKADMLVSIGQHLGGLDENIGSHLPGEWNTLYCLSLLGAATVERCVNEATIHPGLTLNQAKELLAKHRAEHVGPKRPDVSRRLRKFREFVVGTMNEWTPAERGLVCGELALLFEQIATPSRGDCVDSFWDRMSLEVDVKRRHAAEVSPG